MPAATCPKPTSNMQGRGDEVEQQEDRIQHTGYGEGRAKARPVSFPKPDIEPPRHQEHQADRTDFCPHPLCGFVVSAYVGFRELGAWFRQN